MAGALDLFLAFKFVKQLTQDWTEWDAYKLGLIDKDGKKLKKASTKEEKSAMSIFHVLVKNLKKILERIPFGKSKLASYATALFLIKEELGESAYQHILKELNALTNDKIDIAENSLDSILERVKNDNIGVIESGKYEVSGLYEGAVVIEYGQLVSIGSVEGIPVYKARDILSKGDVYFIQDELRSISAAS